MGKAIHFIFPLPTQMPCTESGCVHSVKSAKWYLNKDTIIKHLSAAHNIRITEVYRWCKYCELSIPVIASKHPCLTASLTFNNHRDDVHKCQECDMTFPSKREMANHNKLHKKSDHAIKRILESSTNKMIQRINKLSQESESGTQLTNNVLSSQSNDLTSPTYPDISREASYNIGDDTVQELSMNSDNTQNQDSDTKNDVLIQDIGQSQVDPTILPEIPEETIEGTGLQDCKSPSSEFTSRFKKIYKKADNWAEFLQLLDEYIKFASDFVKLGKARSSGEKARNTNTADPSILQKEYKRNRSTIRKIMNTTPERCKLNSALLRNTSSRRKILIVMKKYSCTQHQQEKRLTPPHLRSRRFGQNLEKRKTLLLALNDLRMRTGEVLILEQKL